MLGCVPDPQAPDVLRSILHVANLEGTSNSFNTALTFREQKKKRMLLGFGRGLQGLRIVAHPPPFCSHCWLPFFVFFYILSFIVCFMFLFCSRCGSTRTTSTTATLALGTSRRGGTW